MLRLQRRETFGDILGGWQSAPVTLSRHAPYGSTGWHRHDSSYLCAVVAGFFLHRENRLETEGQCGALIPVNADEPHCDNFGDAGAICINIFIDDAPRCSSRTASTKARDLLARMAVELALGAAHDWLTLESLCAELTVELFSRADDADDSAIVLKVIEALEDAPVRAWSLSELSLLTNRHHASLARTFRRRTGRTIGDWLRRSRLTRLCLDLSTTDAPLAELAQRHGYSDQAHMTRSFRAFAGLTPGAFRQKWGYAKR